MVLIRRNAIRWKQGVYARPTLTSNSFPDNHSSAEKNGPHPDRGGGFQARVQAQAASAAIRYEKDRNSRRPMASMMPQRPREATNSKIANPAAAADAQLKKSAAEAIANSKGNITYCHMEKPSPRAVAMHLRSDIGPLRPKSP
jgi:hypothetical protein